jgi:hypothetical protein
MKKRLDLIDLDTLLYIVAYVQWNQGNKDNKEQVKLNVKEFINTILLNTRADLYSAVYQDNNHNNFRKYFYPDYKRNRPPAPEFILLWKDIIIEAFQEVKAVGTKIIESDDVLNIGYNRYKEEYDLIIVSGDKDLNQIPGEHYNPRTHISYFVTDSDAALNLFIQVLAGDDGDGINGLYGIGAKWDNKRNLFIAPKARKILTSTVNGDFVHSCHIRYQLGFTDDWYSEYLKAKFLVTLLAEIDYSQYPFSEEVTQLFNIVPVKEELVTNLFE